jgi:hypothetical protein
MIGCMLAVWVGTASAQLAGRAILLMRRGKR